MEILDYIWHTMKWNINFIRFKTNIDRVWKEVMILFTIN